MHNLTRLTELISDQLRALAGRWRRLPAQQQALTALAHQGNGDPLARLAAVFEVSVATVWRYLHEAVDLLAACADDLAAVMRGAVQLGVRQPRRHAFRSTGSLTSGPTSRVGTSTTG